MRKKRFKKDYISVIRYAILLLSFVIFSFLGKTASIYSASVLATALALGASPFVSPILFIASFLVTGNTGLLASASICAGVLCFAVLIYKGFHNKPKYELPAIVALSTIGFIVLGDLNSASPILTRIIISTITCALSLITFITGKAVYKKGLKIKFSEGETACLVVTIALLGLGISNITAPFVWKCVCVSLILFCSFVFRRGICTLISSALGIGLALYYGDITFIALFTLFGLVSEAFTPFSRYASAFILILAEYLAQTVFSIYGAYTLAEFLSTVIGAIGFCITPTFIIVKIKDKLYSFREKQLERQSINRNRLMVSNRLYEISSVFTEMANAFIGFKKNAPSQQSATVYMDKELQKTICENCKNYQKCKQELFSHGSLFIQLISVGLAKGKVSFIDLPKDLGLHCIMPNEVVFALNKMLASYKNAVATNMNLSSGRDLIAAQARGVAEILKGLAIESGSLLKYQSRLERKLTDTLYKNGLSVSELLIYGEGETAVVCVITDMQDIPLTVFISVISSSIGFNVELMEKAVVTDDKMFLSFAKPADYDAVFGLACAKKDGSNLSGDTHSVVRIPNDRLLFAVSDGMGSGSNAEKISSTSLTLIESFYKAGLSSPLILNTVNKLLSVNTEDSFTALDISVVDLKTLSADFIKYGSPYGFIVSDDGIKIIEGNSLPLGILEELKPAVCNSKLNPGDTVILLSDGISDAFGSSAEVIDFLRSVPAKNPQTLAESILERAINLNGGEKKDDMTALAVRVFNRSAV